MNISLEMTLPRLKPEWIRIIMDENRIKETIRIAKREDPERYADATPAKEAHYVTTPLSTLNQYLKNILDDDGTGPQKRISFRNKTFFVQFGRACEHIFRYLNFQEDYEENTQDSYWVPPRLTLQEGKTPLGSPRAFFEDVRSEVQSVLDDKPPIDGQPVVLPISARDPLEKALGCDKIPHPASALPVTSSEAQHLRTLGAPVDADDAMLKFAYNKQVQVDPEHASTYVEALGGLSARRTVDLQMFVFKQQELLTKQQTDRIAAASDAGPIEKAYAHFGLTRDCREAPAYFIGVYKNYRDQSPAQKSNHRVALLQIGRDQDSREILNEVLGTKMEMSEACQFLGVEPEWPMDTIAAMAQTVASVCLIASSTEARLFSRHAQADSSIGFGH
jgi:ubiquitin carboxyl-terminal hydrolase 25/28